MTAAPTHQVRHLLIEGRVQGVGFRWFVRERARRRGLSGWVQNRPDGTVELCVSGNAAVLTAFVAEVSSGPPDAVVSNVHELGASTRAQSGEPLPYPFQIQKLS